MYLTLLKHQFTKKVINLLEEEEKIERNQGIEIYLQMKQVGENYNPDVV